MKKPNGYWNFEKCKDVALKCKTKKEFRNKYDSAYCAAFKNNWLNEICSHMFELLKPSGYWTKERCYNLALNCSTRTEFDKKYTGAYHAARKKGWLNEICSHMVDGHMLGAEKRRKWNFENSQKAALKCNSRSEFKTKYGSAYYVALKNNWLYDICSHMKPLGSKYQRLIYACEFSDNYVYVGLTYNLEERKHTHYNNTTSPIFQHIEETNLKPKFKQKTDFLDYKLAAKTEGYVLKEYKKNGWNILNKAKTGSLGSVYRIWDFDTCKQVASECKTRFELYDKYRSAHSAALKNNWLDEICSHMVNGNIIWNFEKCKQVASECKTRFEFQTKYNSAYNAARKNDWLDKICKHMVEVRKPSGYWNFENCKQLGLECSSRTEFYKKYVSAYNSALKNNWLDIIFSAKR